MTVKIFRLTSRAEEVLAGETYVEGAPVVYAIENEPMLRIDSWHGIAAGRKASITSQLTARGWTEGEETG